MTARPLTTPSLLAALFRGLADPARLSCVLALRRGPRTVGEVVAATRLSQPNASKHLACLRECGLARAERQGRHVLYRLADPDVAHLLETAETILGRHAPTIAACPTYGEGASPTSRRSAS